MTAAELKAWGEAHGFGIAHARRLPRSLAVRAYVAVFLGDGNGGYDRSVTELRWSPNDPDRVEYWGQEDSPGGYRTHDVFRRSVPVEEGQS